MLGFFLSKQKKGQSVTKLISVFKWMIGWFKPNRNQISSFVLGGLAVTAFAPFEFSPIILLSLGGLFALWLGENTAKQSAKTGFWFGLGLFGFGTSWLFSSIYIYADVFLPIAIFLTLAFIIYLSLFTALAGWLAAKFRHKPLLAVILGFPAIWVLMELLRGSVFGGYPFLLSGNSHLHTWLDGYAPVFGVWGMSLAVAMSAGILVALLKYKQWLSASFLLGFVWLGGAGLQQIQWVQPAGAKVDVALMQGNIPQEEKWLADKFIPTLKTYITQTKLNLDADVIVWPETAVPAYYSIVEKGALHSFIKDVQLLDKDVLLGVIDDKNDSDEYFNALINVGNPEDRYHKQHLVPFSEYFPFDDALKFLTGLFDIPYATFSAGTEKGQVLNLGGQPAGVSICFETAFGEELANRLPQAKYMVTVSNDAWFAYTFEPAQQLQDVQMRALELGREFARATNTGHTAIIGVDGRIKQKIEPYEENVLRGKVQPYEGMTPYAQWQRLPIAFVLILIFAVLFLGLQRVKNRPE